MRKLTIIIIATLLFSGSYLMFNSQAAQTNYEDDYVEWQIIQNNRLFVIGDDADTATLSRNKSTSIGTTGGETIGFTQGYQQLMSIESQPVVEGFNGTLNITAFFPGWLENAPFATYCQSTGVINPGAENKMASIRVTILSGSTEVYRESSPYQAITAMNENDAANMSTPMKQVNMTIHPNSTFTLILEVHNACDAQMRIGWGGYGQFSGGVDLIGDLHAPEFRVTIDQSRLAHLEFIPMTMWGLDDMEDMSFSLWGPIPSDDRSHLDADQLQEAFNWDPSITVPERKVEGNRSALTWSGKVPLPVGDGVLDVCIRVVDGKSTDKCHIRGLVRYSVDSEEDIILSSGLWLSIAVSFSGLGFIIYAFRQELLIPLPLVVAVLIGGLLMIPLASDIPDLSSDNKQSDNTRVPAFILLSSSGDSVSLEELLSEHDAVVVGLSLPASYNAYDHISEFDTAKDRLGDDVAFVQILTGDDARMVDLEPLNEKVNGKWPLLLDDGSSSFASGLPSGISDSVVIIDSSGHVVDHRAPTMSSKEIIDSVESLSTGGPQSSFTTMALLLGPCLGLLLLALPRAGWRAPEKPLPPGTLWASIILTGGLGWAMVNLPQLLIVFAPLDADHRIWLDILMGLWMIQMVIVTAIRGNPFEVSFISNKLHSIAPNAFSEWRELEDLERDLLIGTWVGWMAFMLMPDTLPQGVGGTILTGGFGWLAGPFLFCVQLFSAGLVVLIIRFIASWGGRISQMFGAVGYQIFSRSNAWAMTPIAIWFTITLAMSL